MEPNVRWDDWTGDYATVRDLIEETYPDEFRDFNGRFFEPGGFYRGNAARARRWNTQSNLAQFTCPTVLSALAAPLGEDQFTLITLRINDQFNTTIHGFSDRLRGLEGDRHLVLINPDDRRRHGLEEGQTVTLCCATESTIDRRVTGLRVQPYDLPYGCVAAYYRKLTHSFH